MKSFGGPQAANSRETLVKYWADVGLKVDILANYVNNPVCYSSHEAYIQCMAAINTLLAHASAGKLQLVPDAPFYDAAQNVQVKKQIGNVALVTWMPKAQLPKERLAEIHAFENATRAAWAKLLKTGKNVDMEKLVAQMAAPFSGHAEESFVVAHAINEFMQVQDAHSRIMPVELLKKDYASDVVDDLVGVGIHLSERDGQVSVEEVMEGGTAEAAGILPGDQLVAVDGKSVVGDVRKAVAAIKGPEETRIVLGVKRGAETKEFTLLRKKVAVKNVASKLIDDGKTKLAYVKLASFIPENSPEQIEQAIKDLEGRGAEAVVLDLRGNGGGSLHIAVKIAALFLGADKHVVTSKSLYPDAIPDKAYSTAPDAKAVTTLPLVVLVDPMSASASELLSGALQDHKRAWIVGERSFGKGTVQAGLKPLGIHKGLQDKKIVVFQTIARFYLPSGRTNQIVGVSPDFVATQRPGEEIHYPREQDLYPNALSSVGEASHSERAQETVTQLRACLDSQGTAKQNYLAPGSKLPRDYPVHVVLDLMSCFNKLKIQPMAMMFD